MELPELAKQYADHTTNDLLGDRFQLNFLVSAVNHSQTALALLHSMNDYLSNNYDIEINLFVFGPELPVRTPLGGMYHVYDLLYLVNEPLIVTDIICFNAVDPTYPNLVFYCYDPLLFSMSNQELLNKLRNSRAKIICRNEDHRQFLRERLNLGSEETTISEFEITQFRKFFEDQNGN